MKAMSFCNYGILNKSPCEYLDFRSLHMSHASSIQRILCLIECETEWTIQETAILLHLFQTT